MNRSLRAGLWVVVLFASVSAGPVTAAGNSPVVELFEDDAGVLLKELTNPDGPSGEVVREAKDKFSGICSIRVRPLQNFGNIAGWNFPIVEKPGAGQYRYIRFAWKKIGGKGIMIQFSDHGNFDRRYVAGTPAVPWAARKVAGKAPADWQMVTRDLFQDFGPFVLTGLALTPLDGTAGLYDHMYLGRTIADLDRIEAAGLGKKPLKKDLPAARLAQLWKDLTDPDPCRANPAVWTLVAASRQSVPLLKARLRPVIFREDQKRIARLIKELDDEDFNVREHASDELEKMGQAAVRMLRLALEKPSSAEVRHRIEHILSHLRMRGSPPSPEELRTARAIRVLEQIGTVAARRVLKRLASGAAESDLTVAAKAAVGRLSNGAANAPSAGHPGPCP